MENNNRSVTLHPMTTTYTITERAERIYNGVLDIFDYNASNDVTTPLSLAREQVRKIPTRSGNVLIPGAGIGTYVLACLLEGFAPEQITAVEKDPAYSSLGSGIFSRFGVNYVTADYLDWTTRMKFTAIIGNPPYHKNKYSDFYVCFLRRVNEHLKDGGYFSYLIPAKGVNPLSRAHPVLEECGWNEVELGVEKFFPNISTVIARCSGVKGSDSATVKVTSNGRSFDIGRDTVLPLSDNDSLAFSAVEKIFGHDNKMPYYRSKSEPKGVYIYTSRMIGTWHPSKPKGGAYVLQSFVNRCPGRFDGGFINCESINEAEQIQWAISRSLAMRFAINQCGKAAFIPPLFWSYTPDLRGCQTDEDVFSLLGFTNDEVDYVKSWEHNTYKP